jgi:hypothetical protein
MTMLANAYQDVGRLDRAETLARELLARRRQRDGPKSPATAAALAMLGLSLLMQ